MQASKLQLDHYYLDELHFALNERYGIPAIEEDIPLTPEDLDNKVEVGKNPDDELEWFIRLSIRLNDKDSKFPYEFNITLGGFFKVSPDCKPEMIEPLATVNGPSMLYGAAREILATVTARSRFISVFLPSFRFFPMTKKKAEEQEIKTLPEASTKSPTSKTAKSKKAIAKKK